MANTNVQIAELDFAAIKNNFINYLKGQSTFKDYNFSGSALSTLLDVLAYNTQYNAYYLNMVGNEMFLDTALLRDSVVSHAKLLNYTPRSNISPSAIINVTVYGITTSSLTLPQYTNFMSGAINGVNYNFVTPQTTTVNTQNGVAYFTNIELKEGNPSSYSFTVDSTTNPNYIFEIPDPAIDTSTLQVVVQQTSSNTAYQTFTQATSYLNLTSNSTVYFLQEGLNGNYQLQFGDGILGQQLNDGNIIQVSYISTNGSSAVGANSFVLVDSVTGFSNVSITPVSSATNGSDKETIDSIKFTAPKSYASQGRAVTKEDYINIIQQNNIGVTFDAVNVWGGQENNTPVYGQVFICLKPSGAYTLTDTQKQRLITDVIQPVSMMTVVPTIVDPDYNYIQVNANVVYNPKLTVLSSSQLQALITSAINAYSSNYLNTFNSIFSTPILNNYIQNVDPSIITSEISIRVQKKFYPILNVPTTYTLNFGVPLQRGILTTGLISSPSIQQNNPITPTNIITGIYLEEVPQFSAGIQSIQIINPGFNYQYPPTITILGDGVGANASATISGGKLSAINILNSGNNFTSAIVTITNAPNDTSGRLGAAVPILQGQYGTIRSYYYNNQNVKTILNSNVGTIDYINGIITLNYFNPIQIDNALGEYTLSMIPTTTIISSTFDKIITIDPYDPTAITVNLTAKTS